MASTPLIKGSLRAVGLRKTYGKRTVVKDVSLLVESGEVVGLLGPNGAGKTTSFYMIVGIVPVASGRIEIDGTNITGSEEHTSELQSPSKLMVPLSLRCPCTNALIWGCRTCLKMPRCLDD